MARNGSRIRPDGPRASRPFMPGYEMMFGKGLLTWSWAVKHLSKSHNYWITTVHPKGRPHMAGIWGVWLDNKFYFTSGDASRKSKNIRANPSCVVCLDRADQTVIVEGTARRLAWPKVPRRFKQAYEKKYRWKVDPSIGSTYVVDPRVAFGVVENAGRSSPGATRWKF